MKRRILGTAACLLALSAAQAPAQSGLTDSQTGAVARAMDNPGRDSSGAQAPLDGHPTRILAVETANQMQRRQTAVSLGWHQANRTFTGGTGSQVYHVHADWAWTDRVQLGFSYQNYDDPYHKPINGTSPQLKFVTGGFSAKYKLWEMDNLSVAVQGSVEYMSYTTALIGTIVANPDHIIYSAQAPITYRFSPQLQVHVTPGVSVFPDSINGFEFHGTIPSIALGATWKPSERFLAYGAVNVPFGPGNNTISQTQTFSNTPVWVAGGRYNITPKVAFDLYATNGLGASPSTAILTFPPVGETVLAGIQLTYTPGNGAGMRSSYRTTERAPVTARKRALQQDGFTLGAAPTLTPGSVMGMASYGSNDGAMAGAVFSPDLDFQVEAYLDQFAVDGSVAPAQVPAIDELRYAAGVKVRWLDQDAGDPFSLSTRVLFGRDFAATARTGTLYLGVPMSYDLSDRTTLTVHPRIAAFGSTETYGLGFGVNHEILPGLQAIAEVTAVNDGATPVWAAGARYAVPNSAINIDLHATNAIGRTGLGTLVAQDDTRFVLGGSLRFSLR